jgi:inorganic pyrophosphatase
MGQKMSMSKKEDYSEIHRHATYAESKRIMGPHNYYAIADTRENALDQLTEILRSRMILIY